ncbi:MAG: L-serine ammonia-lyase [Victivallaceae bacterium]|nr:L-serine ammonia-lyase [Victivallaceae bacterium]
MSQSIDTSLFELFKIGPGPSSSHTIGPMKAAKLFINALGQLADNILNNATGVEVHLYGSLSLTGKGHGTDRSVAGGLMGWDPENCDSDALTKLLTVADQQYQIVLDKYPINFTADSIIFETDHYDSPFQNTLVFQLKTSTETIFEQEYYSIGGGFIKCKGVPEPLRNMPVYPYSSMSELKNIMRENSITLPELMIANEQAISGLSEDEILGKLDRLASAMIDAVNRGINSEGILPGPIKLSRKAPALYLQAGKMADSSPERFLAFLDAYSLAASEENAAGHLVVTAPTSGASGVVPGIVYLLKHHYFMLNSQISEGLMAAAAIGFIAKHNASISGAEVGCQGEIGVAAAMAAGLVAYINGLSMDVVENAAEIALEHHLGMTCDPIDGYVQIPCIERNAVGAITAYNSYILASIGDPHKHKISFDEVVAAMLETGRDMSHKYKETAQGGLAVCTACC